MNFKIQRDNKRKPYMVTYFKGKEVVDIRPANILQFYKVTLDNKDFGFEIRTDDAGNIIVDSDDSLTEFLFYKGLTTEDRNKIIEKISADIHIDYYGDKP